MARKQYVFMLALALIAGVIGGALTSKFWLLRTLKTPEDSEVRKVIVANEIHLVDNEGKDRWVLALSKEGEPSVTFVNKNGWAPMAIGVNKDGLPFFNMILEPSKHRGPTLVLMDSTMKNRALLGLREDGEPYLALLDNNGQIRATLGSTELENPLTGSMEKRPPSSLVLFDEDGRIIWSAPQLIALPVHVSRSMK